MELIIVTGMSGAGKTRAINALEDIGYFCANNIPPALLPQFAELATKSSVADKRVAIVVDSRSNDMFGDLGEGLRELNKKGLSYQVLFLEAEDGIILHRYKETRRRHPLIDCGYSTMEEAIQAERKLLQKIKNQADFVVDTSLLSVAQLKERVTNIFLRSHDEGMMVNCMSFGFKYSLPAEADLVFDVRCLPNPFYQLELRPQTGLDAPVQDFVLGHSQARGLIPRLFDLVDYLIPLYLQEGKSQLVIAIGCTGGQHRSVVFTQLLGQHLEEMGIQNSINHRDIKRKQI